MTGLALRIEQKAAVPDTVPDPAPLQAVANTALTIYSDYDDLAQRSVDLANEALATTDTGRLRQIADELRALIPQAEAFSGRIDAARTAAAEAIDAFQTAIEALFDDLEGSEYLAPDDLAADIESDAATIEAQISAEGI